MKLFLILLMTTTFNAAALAEEDCKQQGYLMLFRGRQGLF